MTTPATALSLGDMLRQFNQENSISRQTKSEAFAIENYFKNARARFTGSIKAGEGMTPLKVRGVGEKLARYLRLHLPEQITDPGHPYHSSWASFSAWAESNGLVAHWRKGTDGAGKAYWYTLSVEPI